MKYNNFENIKKEKVSLLKEDIHHLSEENDLRLNWHKELNWPIELQGSGRRKEGNPLQYELHYPIGDIFISFSTLIHELGHLRQYEFKPEYEPLESEPLQKSIEKQVNKEIDAYNRGLMRVKSYRPDILEVLNNKFQNYKRNGYLDDFSSFEVFYTFMMNSIKINRALGVLGQIDDEKERDDMYRNTILQNQEILDFFNQINNSRVDEIIDPSSTDKFILYIFEKIKDEVR